MPIALQHRRGTTAQHSSFTGAQGEVTVDTTKNTVVVHDGSTAGGIPLATEAAVKQTLPGVRGLIGAVNATTPLTKYDLSADAVTLKDSAGNITTRFSTGTLTCNLGLAGSAANGRDQSAAFTASSWAYIYFIWDGSTLATLASTTAPSSFDGSTLPTGYTHWAFATALRWNSSSNIVPMLTRGSKTFYDSALSAVRALSFGQATSFTTVTMTSYVPPIASYAKLNFTLAVTHSSAGVSFTANYRVGGSSSVNGFIGIAATSQVASVQFQGTNLIEVALNSSQQIEYNLNNAPSSGGLLIDVHGFTVPNGDA